MAESVTIPNDTMARLRAKYPQYNAIPDQELADRIVRKYPQYEPQLGPIARQGRQPATMPLQASPAAPMPMSPQAAPTPPAASTGQMATRYGSRAQLEANLRQQYGVDKWDTLPTDIKTSLVDQYARPMNLPSAEQQEVSLNQQDLLQQTSQFGTPRTLGYSFGAGMLGAPNIAYRAITGEPTAIDQQMNALRQTAPVASTIGEFAGGIADPVFLAAGGALGKTVAGPLLRTTAEGGSLGARLGGGAAIGGVTMGAINAIEGAITPPEGMSRLEGAAEGFKSGFGQGSIGGLLLTGAGEALGMGLSSLTGRGRRVPTVETDAMPLPETVKQVDAPVTPKATEPPVTTPTAATTAAAKTPAEPMPMPPTIAGETADQVKLSNSMKRGYLVQALIKQGMNEEDAVKVVGYDPPQRQYPVERGLQQARAASGQPLVEATITEQQALAARQKGAQVAGRSGVQHGRDAVAAKQLIDIQNINAIPSDLLPANLDRAALAAKASTNWRQKLLAMNTVLEANGIQSPLSSEQVARLAQTNASHPAMLSPDMLASVRNTAKAYQAMLRNHNRLIAGIQNRTATEAAVGMVNDVLAVKERVPSRLGERFDRIVDKAKAAFNEGMTPIPELIRQRSATLKGLYDRVVVDGRNKYLTLKHEATRDMHRVLSSIGVDPQSRKARNWQVSPVQVELSSGPITMRRDERIALVAHLLDPYQHNLATQGTGFVLGRGRSERVITLSPKDITYLMTKTPADEMKVAREAIRQFNQGNIRNAADLEIEKNQGYRKLLRDNYWVAQRDMTKADTGRGTGTLYQRYGRHALENEDILLSREGGTTPIRVNPFFDEWSRHLDVLAKLAGYMNPIRDMEVVVGSAAVKDNYTRRFGAGFLESVRNNAMDEAMSDYQRSDIDAVARKVISSAARSVLKLNITSAMVQPTGLFVTLADTNPRYIMAARRAPAQFRTIDQIASKFSPQWVERYSNYARSASGGTILESTGYSLGKQDEPKLIKKMDELVGAMRWLIAEQEVKAKNPNAKYRSDEFNEKVARTWERMTNSSDNTAFAGENSRVLAAGRENPMFGMYTMFSSAPNKVYGMSRRAIDEAAKGNVKQAAKIASMLALAAYYEATVRRGTGRLVYGKDDDQSVNMNALKNGVASLPVVGQILNTSISKMEGQPAFEFGRTPIDRIGNDIINLTANVYKAIDESDNEKAMAAFKSGLDLVGIATGTPIGNIEKLYTGITNER